KMATPPREPPEDARKQSFWMPGNYKRTVHRTDQSYQACNDIMACFLERAKVEKQYAQQLSQWSSKWKSIVDSRPLYGSLMRAWQCFFTSTERLSALHSSISQSLISEEGERVRAWQKETFPKKMFCGFRESYDNDTSFSRVQKPWTKKLKKLDSVRLSYHKACQKEQTVIDKEKQANESETTPEKQQKLTAAREKATEEKEKVRERYEKVLEEVTSCTPRYMEEMEAIFDQSQEEERKRISFLKQAFLSIHRHLDITNNESVKAVYSELHHTLMSISEQDDLRWWKNNRGPGMPTDWPKIEVHEKVSFPNVMSTICVKKKKKTQTLHTLKTNYGEFKGILQHFCVMIGGVKVRALYDYVGEEGDELSFKAGEVFLKVEEEDDQGWCRGILSGGKEGFYPANYVEVVE
uniref:Zgc:91999 n=1 Tax=Myripristis murdjan TaxID=586833 RepID=A0A667YWC3_9TELE